MKKSIKFIISICFIISMVGLITGILLFFKSPSDKTLTEDKFKDYLDNVGCSLIDANKKYSGVNFYHITDKESCPFSIGFIKFDTEETKDAFYSTALNDIFSDDIKSSKKIDFKNYLEQSTTGDEYKSVTVKEDTIMYLSTDNKNKDLAIDILYDLGYHYEPEWKALPLIYISLAITSIMLIISWWKINVKLGRKGWICLIPVYNIVCLFKDIFGSWAYCLLLLIPAVNVLIMVMLLYKLGKKFDKSDSYCVGLIFLFSLFIPLLAFDKSKIVKN